MVIAIIVGIVLGVRALLHSNHQQALESFDQSAGSLAAASVHDVSRPYFHLLDVASRGPSVNAQNRVNQIRVNATAQLGRAERLDPPGQLDSAQRTLALVLRLRRDAIARTARVVQSALNQNQNQAAVATIANSMRLLLASDVLYAQRVVPEVRGALHDAGVRAEPLPPSRFLPDESWLKPPFVAAHVGKGAQGPRHATTPGPHGHALTAVGADGVTLRAGVLTRVPVSGGAVTFDVSFSNGGAAIEHNVGVRVLVQGGTHPLRVNKTVPTTRPGQSVHVAIPLGATPPLGRDLTVVVTIAGVAGETNTSNNTASYPVVFTGAGG